MEVSNLRFLIQSRASYHWTNPQNWRGGAGIRSGPAAGRQGKPAGNCQYNNTRRAVCQGLPAIICRTIAYTGQHTLPSFPEK